MPKLEGKAGMAEIQSLDGDPVDDSIIVLESRDAEEGFVIDDEALLQNRGVAFAHDGHTVLIPTPSTDPKDPLNWSSRKKHLIVFVISCCAFLPDYGSATGGVVLLTQSK